MIINRYEIYICQGCIDLEGEECHTPGCYLCWASTPEIKEILDRIQLRIEFKDSIVYHQPPESFYIEEEE